MERISMRCLIVVSNGGIIDGVISDAPMEYSIIDFSDLDSFYFTPEDREEAVKSMQYWAYSDVYSPLELEQRKSELIEEFVNECKKP